MASNNEQLVRALYAAYHARNWNEFRALIGDGFTFTSPYDDAIDIVAYRERCWPPGDDQIGFKIDRVVSYTDGAYITYFVTVKSGLSFRNTESLTIAEDKVVKVDVYFGASYRGGEFIAKKPG